MKPTEKKVRIYIFIITFNVIILSVNVIKIVYLKEIQHKIVCYIIVRSNSCFHESPAIISFRWYVFVVWITFISFFFDTPFACSFAMHYKLCGQNSSKFFCLNFSKGEESVARNH